MMTMRLSRPRQNSVNDNGRVFRNSKAFDNKQLCKASVFAKNAENHMSPLKVREASGPFSPQLKTEIKNSPRQELEQSMQELVSM